uniref:Uncharacterized protein n=1 Tax=Cyclopterus lumpus TaxID=8103 RepID=A0A8C2XFK6_CYCLU
STLIFFESSVGQFSTGSTLGVEVCKVHRRFSGNLQLPPLSWRQVERDRDRVRPLTPEEDPVTWTRPSSLPICSLPRIDITQAIVTQMFMVQFAYIYVTICMFGYTGRLVFSLPSASNIRFANEQQRWQFNLNSGSSQCFQHLLFLF